MKMNTSIFALISLFLAFSVSKSAAFTNNPWLCKNAYVKVSIVNDTDLLDSGVDVMYQYKVCRECELILLTAIDSKKLTVETIVKSNYDYYFEVARHGTKETICPRFEYNEFGECGLWSLEVMGVNNCTFNMISKPLNTYIYLYIALAIIIVIIAIVNLAEKYPDKFRSLFHLAKNKAEIAKENAKLTPADNKQDASISMKTMDAKEEDKQQSDMKATPEVAKQVKKRVESLDTFRGLSLILMIMVTYAWEGFPIIHHLPWNGINIGTLVLPWFLWIMGFSIPLSIHSVARKSNANRWKIFFRIFTRTVKMFAIGIILNIKWGTKVSELRIFGVLQRIAICYFVLATLELIFYKTIDSEKPVRKFRRYFSDLIYSWKQSVIVILITIAWFLITFLLPVPGCPKGFFGPGGLEYNSTYFNCTGGAAGYIDKIILTDKHMYLYSTPIEIYKNGFFDPEGILGTLTSILLAYLGSQAGRVLIFHKNKRDQLMIWFIWIIFILVLFFGFTQGDMYNGWIPVNKNIWTFTFSLISGATALGILFVFYIIIDILRIWTGTPFKYPGKNSIVVYVAHYLFMLQFPVQWSITPSHLSLLVRSLYGITFWILVSAYMHYKNVFVNL